MVLEERRPWHFWRCQYELLKKRRLEREVQGDSLLLDLEKTRIFHFVIPPCLVPFVVIIRSFDLVVWYWFFTTLLQHSNTVPLRERAIFRTSLQEIISLLFSLLCISASNVVFLKSSFEFLSTPLVRPGWNLRLLICIGRTLTIMLSRANRTTKDSSLLLTYPAAPLVLIHWTTLTTPPPPSPANTAHALWSILLSEVIIFAF